MPLKSPSHNLGPEYDYLGDPEDIKTNALGLTWDTQQDTLEPIFYYHLSKKVTGIKQAYELVGHQIFPFSDNSTELRPHWRVSGPYKSISENHVVKSL